MHHVVPYRTTRDNSPLNLVAVCRVCHVNVQRASDRIAELHPRARAAAAAIIAAHLEDSWHIHAGRALLNADGVGAPG